MDCSDYLNVKVGINSIIFYYFELCWYNRQVRKDTYRRNIYVLGHTQVFDLVIIINWDDLL